MKQILPLAHKLERMTPRERVVLTLCALALVWFGFDQGLVQPALKDSRNYADLNVSTAQELENTRSTLEGLRSGEVPAGDPALFAELKEAENKIRALDVSLRASQEYFVPPERMSSMLSDLLRRDSRLELVSLKSLPGVSFVTPVAADEAELIADAKEAKPEAAGADKKPALEDVNMFRFGSELVVRGNYLDVLAYLKSLEALPWRVYWGKLTMQARAGAPDKTEFVITLYTLSLDKSWLLL